MCKQESVQLLLLPAAAANVALVAISLLEFGMSSLRAFEFIYG